MGKGEVLDNMKEELAEIKRKLKHYEQRAEEKIQDHPVASVSIAFGTGMLVGSLIGFMLSRR